MTSPASATLFATAAPLWVGLAPRLFLHERLASRFWFALFLTLTGSVAVLGTDFSRHFTLGLGDLLAVAASLFYAGYYMMTQSGRRHLGSLAYVAAAGLIASVLLLAICLLAGFRLTGYPPQTRLAFLGLALVTQVVGYLGVGDGLGHLPASVVAP